MRRRAWQTRMGKRMRTPCSSSILEESCTKLWEIEGSRECRFHVYIKLPKRHRLHPVSNFSDLRLDVS